MPSRKSRKSRKSRERSRTAAGWLARLKGGGGGKSPLQLPPDFVLWVLAALLSHLDRRGDAHLADLAEGALLHGAGLAAHDTRHQRGGPAHQAALQAIAQAFADLDLRRGRRQDSGAWELLDKVEAAYTGLCVGLKPDGSHADRDYLDEEMKRLWQKSLTDPSTRRTFRSNLRRRVLRAALDEVARRRLSARATAGRIRKEGDDIRHRLHRAGLLKLVGGSVPFFSTEGTEI